MSCAIRNTHASARSKTLLMMEAHAHKMRAHMARYVVDADHVGQGEVVD